MQLPNTFATFNTLRGWRSELALDNNTHVVQRKHIPTNSEADARKSQRNAYCVVVVMESCDILEFVIITTLL